MIDVRRLRVLQAVIESGSLVGAAESLSYTSSAISQQIAALERETGTTLFERAGRGVRPTDAALLLSEHAGRVLGAIDEAEHALAALRAGHIGRLRITAFPTAGSSLVPGALASFRELHPNVSLDLVVAEVDESIKNLRSGTTDVAVVVRSSEGDDFESDEFDASPLFTDPFRIVLPRHHRLAARRDVNLGDLAKERWIAVSSCPGYCQEVGDDACANAGFRPHYALEADDYGTVQGFVAAGLGVALVPMLSLGTSLHPGIVARKLKGEQPRREVWIVTRRGASEQPLVRTMSSCLQASAVEFAAHAL